MMHNSWACDPACVVSIVVLGSVVVGTLWQVWGMFALQCFHCFSSRCILQLKFSIQSSRSLSSQAAGFPIWC